MTTLIALQPLAGVYVITAVPAATPDTMPVRPTDANADPVPQVPPETALLSEVADPTQTFGMPVMAGANGDMVTVTVTYTEQPAPEEYVIIDVPADMPVTTPVEEPTAAVVGALLVQVPPVALLLNVVDRPAHMDAVPTIAEGGALTTMVVEEMQPPGAV